MIKNYFKIALRNIAKQKTLSFINIIGLSIGIACFTLFLLYTVNEFSFDKFNKNAKDIFRVYLKVQGENGEKYNYSTYHPMPLGPSMRQDIPDVENFTRIREAWGESLVRLDNSNEVRREEITYADASIFIMFSFKFIYGQPTTALGGMQNIVLTQNKALELFGNTNVLGRTIQIKVDDNFQPFTVSAVVENNRPNSSIKFDVLGNFSFLETTSYGKRSMNNWNRASLQTFVQLRQGSGLPNNETVFLNFRKKYYPNEIAELDKEGIKWDHSKTFATYNLQPLLDIHTNTQLGGVIVESIDPKKIWLVLGIAAIVLLIACINFTTLAIGRLASRAKEVGVRKVIGGQRKQLIAQFLCEAILLAIISAMVGLLIAKLLLPYFNNLSGRELVFSFTMFPQIAWILLAVTLFVGLLAGSYPALVLSGFRPVEVLKTKVRINGSNLFTRSLVTLQFTLSIALIISTLVILKQTNYMSNKNPGFNKENVLMVDANDIDTKKVYPLFRQSLISNTNITGIASAELGLGEGEGWSQTGFEYNGKHKQVYEFFIDRDYMNVLGMQLLAGRNFDYNIAADTATSVIINEAMMKDFGWSLANAIGQPLKGYSEKKTPVVIGVVKDFNFRSLKEKVSPQMFQAFADYVPYKFFVRIKPGNPSQALASINKVWKSFVPDFPLKYSFLDESLDKFYKSEKRWRSIAGWAGGISIFLACLGLFGLAALAVVNRTKEIGIRKVLGASLTGIVAMVSKEFIKLVIIALVIASALAWFLMNKWLQDYAYRINLSYVVFLMAGLFAIAVALLTVGFHAMKAAIANPVKSLRTE